MHLLKIKKKRIMKTFGNTTTSQAKDNVSDMKTWGENNVWRLITKAWSEKEGWMKSTKAMQLPNGCLVQVTTQQDNNIAEAVTYIPGVKILEIANDKGEVEVRRLIPLYFNV